MNENTYWLHWKRYYDRFMLIDWEDNDYADYISKVFWPSLSVDQLKDSVLLECEESGEQVTRDIKNQNLPNLDTSKLPFVNVKIIATPKQDQDIGDYIECVYTVEDNE